MNPNPSNRKTGPVPICPVCDNAGSIWTDTAPDCITGIPDKWIFRLCSNCESLWQDPCTVDEDIGKLYPENYGVTRSEIQNINWNGFRHSAKAGILAGHYGYSNLNQSAQSKSGFQMGKLVGHFSMPRLQAGRMVRFLSYRQDGRLLDVGCGNGSFLKLMKSFDWEVEGIEPDPKAARVAVDSGLKVMSGMIEDAELPHSYYDAITLSHVMEHFRQPRVALEKIAACLKPGGVFVSISPNPVGLISKLFRDHWYGLDAPRHLVIPSPKGYRIMCEQFGFETRCFTTMHIAYWILRESLSIRRTGKTGQCRSRFLPKIFSSVASLAMPFFPEIGEEVVCYAIKK
jgi:2-polyprenyl-3-methyl-5-hydroxy-6-metoxy-1,4-benzoquinol methylase